MGHQKSRERLLTALTQLRAEFQGKRLVFVSGNFNIVHPGHLRLLNFARDCGEVLLVGLFSDAAPGVLVRFEDRRDTLLGLESVSSVIDVSGDDDLSTVINFLQPAVVVKGKEHQSAAFNLERDLVAQYGGHLVFSSGEHQFSTRDLLRRDLRPDGTWGLLSDRDFLRQHDLSLDGLARRVQSFAGLRIVVLGDLIVDEYIYCDPIGMSQEDPTIVVTPIESRKFVGGAGIVAAHLAGLGARVQYLSITGDDETAQLAKDLLDGYRVESHFVRDESRPTTLKQRFRAQNKTLLRVSSLRNHDAGEEYWSQMLKQCTEVLETTDLLVFSDFNYGCLPPVFVDALLAVCRGKGVRYVADSQSSSQVGDVGRFVGADFLSATEREARLSVNDFRSGLQNVANVLLDKSDCEGLFIKLGAEGLIYRVKDPESVTKSLRALNPNPVDVAGAGDAFLATAALCRASGGGFAEAAYLGSVAAALQVGKVGNIPLTTSQLIATLNAR